MTRKIENLTDLFLVRGKEHYEASLQEQKELPHIENRATNPNLKEIINREINAAAKQNAALNKALQQFNIEPKGEKGLCCQSILKETKRLIHKSKVSAVRDAAILESIQRLNHNNISSLGTLATYAIEIGKTEIASSLYDMLKEEKAIDENLTSLAKVKINKQATIAV